MRATRSSRLSSDFCCEGLSCGGQALSQVWNLFFSGPAPQILQRPAGDDTRLWNLYSNPGLTGVISTDLRLCALFDGA